MRSELNFNKTVQMLHVWKALLVHRPPEETQFVFQSLRTRIHHVVTHFRAFAEASFSAVILKA